MEITIPKTFTLFGETIKVKQVVKVDKKDNWGEHNPTGNVIKVKKTLITEQKEQAYFHEMIHCILTHLSYNELNQDEEFVDRFAKALHQVLKTSE